MLTVHKYPIELTDRFAVNMPRDATCLYVATQQGVPQVWARVDTNSPIEFRQFYLRGTGHDLGDAAEANYVGSFQLQGGALVFHLFEKA